MLEIHAFEKKKKIVFLYNLIHQLYFFSFTSQTFIKVSEGILVMLEIWRGLGYFRDFRGIFGHFEVLGYF